MKTFCRSLAVTALVLVTAGVSSANVIVNGSFEILPAPFPASNWDLYENILGWSSPVDLIELGKAGVYGVTGFDGQNVLELDANHNVTVSQVVATTPGAAYTLSFLYADRANVAPSSATLQVWWNSALLQSLSPTSTAMTLFSLVVTATGSDTLEFKGTGTDDSFGALVDNVQLNPVPDGGLTSALLGLGIVGLGFVRRIVG